MIIEYKMKYKKWDKRFIFITDIFYGNYMNRLYMVDIHQNFYGFPNQTPLFYMNLLYKISS